MHKKLTAKAIDNLPPATRKRYEVRDELVTGLLLRVSVKGGKVWYLSARLDGRVRRIKLGAYPILSLSDAREKARLLLRNAQLGVPVEPTPSAPTLGVIIPQFIALYARPRNRDWKGTEGILGKFASLDHRPIDTIRRSDVVRILDEIVASGTPYRANRALAAIKKLMAWCLDRGTIEMNPVAGLRPPTKEVARDRVLSDTELAACWQAAEDEDFPFGPFLQLLILTGQRRGEVAGIRWSEIDMERGIWTLPAKRAKNASQHMVPLPYPALELLRSVPRFLNSDYVFTTTGRTPISGFGRLKERLGADVDWRLHDIRRTVATNMAMMAVPPHVIEAVLNHRTGIVSGVAAIYNRHAYLEEKRQALEAWAERVSALVAAKDHHANRNSSASHLGRTGSD